MFVHYSSTGKIVISKTIINLITYYQKQGFHHCSMNAMINDVYNNTNNGNKHLVTRQVVENNVKKIARDYKAGYKYYGIRGIVKLVNEDISF